jgi:hypothetical protein
MSGLGTKMRVRAEDIRPGDFTTFSGFRHVVDVTPVLESWGRGKNRVVDQLTGVILHRSDGDTDKLTVSDAEAPTYTVFRQT